MKHFAFALALSALITFGAAIAIAAPGEEEGRQAVTGHLAGLDPRGFSGPDLRDCVHVASFAAETGETLRVAAREYHILPFRLTVSYTGNCQWSLTTGRGLGLGGFWNPNLLTLDEHLDQLLDDAAPPPLVFSSWEVETTLTLVRLQLGESASKETLALEVKKALAAESAIDESEVENVLVGSAGVLGGSVEFGGEFVGRDGESETIEGNVLFLNEPDTGWVVLAIRVTTD